jgi:hypothetical protein
VNWIGQIVTALLRWLQGLAERDKTIQDAKTPKPIRDAWAGYLRDRLPPKDGGGGQPK